MANAIPTRSRELVKARDRGCCAICGNPARVGQWSHRRRRGREADAHSPANGLWTHVSCHAGLHDDPIGAKARGWMVSQFVADVTIIPVDHALYGMVYLDHDGGHSPA